VNTPAARSDALRALRRALVTAAFTLLTAVLGLVVTAAIVGSYGHLRSLLLLSALGLAVGCLLGALHVGCLERWPRLALGGFAAIVASQLAFHLLVWSGWKTQTLPWRAWWIAMVASLLLSHLALLALARRRGRDPLVATAAWTALPAAVGWALLALRRDLLAELHPAVLVLGALPIVVTVVSSLAVAVRAARLGQRQWSLPVAWRRGLLVLSHAAVLLVGLYLGRIAVVRSGAAGDLPSALAHMSGPEIDAQLEADLRQLRSVVAGLEELERDMAVAREQVRVRQLAEGRDYFLPAEDDALRWSFVTFLSYRTALLRQVTTYSGFEAVADELRRARCFLLGYAAAVTHYRSAVDLVEAYGTRPLERRKLNEAEPSWGLPAGMFDQVSSSVSSERQVELAEEMAAHFEHRRAGWRAAGVWPEADFKWLEGHILSSLEAVRRRRVDSHRRWLGLVLDKVRSDAYTPVYAVQSLVAEWIGDVRIVERPPFIGEAEIARIRPRLKPGDILLERRSWYASNAFLPGFWPHAALYVGTLEDLERLGVSGEPEVVRRLEDYRRPAADGHSQTVIEAVGEGVIFSSLEHSLSADYAAVLRPRLSEAEIARAIATAFRHQGKPYDFEFDFFTADRLVCTELVYRSYLDLLHFKLVNVMRRDTLPAIEIVRKYARERGTPGQELDLVLFLDGDPALGRAVEADEQAFIASAERPREFNE